MAWTINQVKQKLPHLYIPNRWKFVMVKPPSATNGAEIPVLSWDDLDLRCQTSDIPKPSANNVEVQVHGHKIKQTTGIDYSGQITLTFYQGVDFKVEQFFWGLFNAQDKLDDLSQSERESIKFDFKLVSLDNNLSPARTILIVGALVTDMDASQLVGDQQADPSILTVTIDYDYHERIYGGG